MPKTVVVDAARKIVVSAPGPQGATGPGGGVTDGDKGDIVVSGSGATFTIDEDAVTFAKMQNVTGPTLIGRSASSSGNPEAIGLGTGLTIDGSKNLAISTAFAQQSVTMTAGTGLTGGGDLSANRTFALADAGVSTAKLADAAVTTAKIADEAVTAAKVAASAIERANIADGAINAAKLADDAVSYAKLQNVSAASRLLGRGDSGSGDAQEITIGSGLSMTGTTLAATGGGGSGAPTAAQYVVLATHADLSAERVLTAGTGITLTDGGANNNATLAVSYGTSSTTACVGNDARLSDDRYVLFGKKSRLFSHCNEDTPIGGAFAGNGSGTATAGSETGKFGIYRLATNTTASANQGGRVRLIAVGALDFSDVTRAEFQANMRVSTQGLSGTNTGFIIIGFHDAGNAAVVPYNGCYFRSENGGNWFAVAESNQTETTEDTGIAADSTWRSFKIVVETIGGTLTAKYYIEGTEEASLTTNIPTADTFGGSINLMRTASTTSQTVVQIDWFYYDLDHADVTL